MNKELQLAIKDAADNNYGGVLHRTWFRDINGNSYQSAALYIGGTIIATYPKSYQGVEIDKAVKQLRENGMELLSLTTKTKLKDFYI